MIPAAFAYHRPDTVEEALELLERHGEEARLLAGGHSLLPVMKLRLAAPEHLVDLGRVRSLNFLRAGGCDLVVGATVTHARLAECAEVRERWTALAEAAAAIGDVQVRNRGTLGGALAHNDPAGDYPAALLALEGEVICRSRRGERRLAAADFLVDMFATALAPAEILTEVRFPALPPNTGSAYVKVPQPASGFALCGVAAVLTREGDRLIRARVGITGVAPCAYRARSVEEALEGREWTPGRAREAAEGAAEGVAPLSDLHASDEYRAHLARVTTRKALERAAARAGS